jgi:hypothetical protein
MKYNIEDIHKFTPRCNERSYLLDCGTELTVSQVVKVTGLVPDCVYKRLNKQHNTTWAKLTRPIKKHKTNYLLTDGTTMNAPQLAKIVGCTTSTACLRLQKSDDRDVVTRKLEDRNKRNMEQDATWGDKPVRIIMGIPINPSYMDGQMAVGGAKDREGNKLKFGEQSSLMRYRKKQRDEWLEGKGVINQDDLDKDWEDAFNMEVGV